MTEKITTAQRFCAAAQAGTTLSYLSIASADVLLSALGGSRVNSSRGTRFVFKDGSAAVLVGAWPVVE